VTFVGYRLHRYSLDVTAQEEIGCIISSSTSKDHRDPLGSKKTVARGPTSSRKASIACGVAGSDKRRTLRLQMHGCWLPGFRGRSALAQDAQHYCSAPCWREDAKSRSLPLHTTSGVGNMPPKNQTWRCHYAYTAAPPPTHPLMLMDTCLHQEATQPRSQRCATKGCCNGGENGAFCATTDRMSWSKISPLKRIEPGQSHDEFTECDNAIGRRRNEEVIGGQCRRDVQVYLNADGEPTSNVICNCRVNHDDRDAQVKRGENEATERQASTW